MLDLEPIQPEVRGALVEMGAGNGHVEIVKLLLEQTIPEQSRNAALSKVDGCLKRQRLEIQNLETIKQLLENGRTINSNRYLQVGVALSVAMIALYTIQKLTSQQS